MLGSESFAGTITERPTGMTSGGGCPWRPSRGWRTRVKLPGGSFPMIVLVSTPIRRSASACNSACSTTPPQKDQEYGTTIPTFIAARRLRDPSDCAAPGEERDPAAVFVRASRPALDRAQKNVDPLGGERVRDVVGLHRVAADRRRVVQVRLRLPERPLGDELLPGLRGAQ